MPRTRISISESYNTLGLPNGVDIEEVKKSYKKLALQYHPDKAAPEISKEEATLKFQEIGEAYSVLKNHLEGPRHPHHPPSRKDPFGFDDEDDEDDSYDDADYFNDFDEDSEDESDRMAFYMYLFNSFLNGSRRSGGHNHRNHHHHHHHNSGPHLHFGYGPDGRIYAFSSPGPTPRREPIPEETAEQRQARIDQERREREEAAARREHEAKLRRERKERERIAEAEAAAERQKNKARARKEAHMASQNQAAQKAQEVLARRQKIRSKAFDAARKGDAAAVQKGIWEDEMDAAGGELLKGAEEFVKGKPSNWDKLETLLHIAVSKEDKKLVEWLVDHSAEPEERDRLGQTAFNRALAVGNTVIIDYFLTTYDPEDSDSLPVLGSPKSSSNLRLAATSGKVEVVRKVIEAGLVDVPDVAPVWNWIIGQERGKKTGAKSKWEAIKDVLKQIDGWEPTPSKLEKVGPIDDAPEAKPEMGQRQHARGGKTKKRKDASIVPEPQSPTTPGSSPSAASTTLPSNQDYKRQSRPAQQPGHSRPSSYSEPQPSPTWQTLQTDQAANQGERPSSRGGRGRGISRGRGGRGRGRGGFGPRGTSFVATATAC